MFLTPKLRVQSTGIECTEKVKLYFHKLLHGEKENGNITNV